ncbi:MAG: DNA double-strand break repair protein Mre11, partial [Dehalococcoidales bacterium]
PDIYKIPTRSGTVQVASLPWLRRSVLLSREETKNLDFEQMKEKLQQALTSAIELNISKLDPKLPAILAAHAWVAGSQIGTEKQMTIGQEHVLLLSSVANPAFDYIALGHIHRHQALSENPPVVYAGSLARLDFGDEADEKGFYLVDIESGKARGQRQVSFEFHPVAGRRFLTIEAALEAEDSDPTTTVLGAIAGQEKKLKEAIVRLNITVPSSLEGQLRDADIREALQDAHFATVARETVREARLRLGQFTAEEITPLDALKKYLETKKTPPARAKVLMEYGERLIRGE